MASELSRPKNRGCSVSESSPDVQSMFLVHMYGISHCKEKNKTNTFLNNRKKISTKLKFSKRILGKKKEIIYDLEVFFLHQQCQKCFIFGTQRHNVNTYTGTQQINYPSLSKKQVSQRAGCYLFQVSLPSKSSHMHTSAFTNMSTHIQRYMHIYT